MAFIYKITNKINNKSYIGFTNRSIEVRWEEHKRSYGHLDFPLYRAFLKYGIENFKIKQIEEVEEAEVSERERYWIEFYDTYKDGYNATLGGEGSITFVFTEKEILKYFNKKYEYKEIAEIKGCSVDTVAKAVQKYSLDFRGQKQKNFISCWKNGKRIKNFDSAGNAARWVIKNGFSKGSVDSASTNIMRVCKGIRNQAYGFFWEKIDGDVV